MKNFNLLKIKNGRWVGFYIGCMSFLLVLIIGLFFAYDPMMQFHKPWGRDITLHKNMRLQASGIIRNLDHDSYILGTSMLENTSARKASNLIGGDFANISMSGSDFYERSFPLSLATENNAERIIYSVDSAYIGRREGRSDFPVDSFAYLYTTDIALERVKLYFQPKFFACMLMFSSSQGCVGRKTTTDMPNNWLSASSRFGGIENWLSDRNDDQVIKALELITSTISKIKEGEYEILPKADLDKEIAKSIGYVDNYLISHVRSNPNTKFELVFPPYSRIRYAQWHQLNGTAAKIHEAIVRHLAKAASKHMNLNVYGYEDMGFLDEIENYKDTGHYAPWVNDMMLEDIASGRHLLTEKNVDSYIKAARRKAKDFDLISLGERIDAYLGREN